MVDVREQFFAHTRDGVGQEGWQGLVEHLEGVAERASGFADAFGAGEWGDAAGLWHDLGKFAVAFQKYLRGEAQSPIHAFAGARQAIAANPVLGFVLAYCIAGHHAGLPDGRSENACLLSQLNKKIEPWEHGLESTRTPRPLAPVPPLQQALDSDDPFAASFFTRMVFSCLVDADFLDTEAFVAPDRARHRPSWPDGTLTQMETALKEYMRAKQRNAEDSHVNQQRAEVLQACRAAASLSPGFFSLTVPTGGGKTLSSLAFALRHAVAHGLKRIIYVVPFTSIIEQNAEVFREAMTSLVVDGGKDPVLEHHSNLQSDKDTKASRLATENWDSPLIVTTSVQFYESLFGHRTSRCRKLHNIANAVVILDEVQALPVDLLKPCLKALDQLTRNYRTSIVLCTATQPAIHRRDDFKIGLDGVREIIPDPPTLYETLKRVKTTDIGGQTDEELGEKLLGAEIVLCVVNTRNHAQRIYEILGDRKGHFHLSARMCPEHRTAVIKTIRQRLGDGKECRVISTQLIEAGVDIDFPIVYRSLAGLDSIAQAAGRCNRNGTLGDEGGRTYVFRSEHPRSERFLRDTTNTAEQVLDLFREDPLSLKAIERYFKLYYWDQTARWDAKRILDNFKLLHNDRDLPFSFSFATAARDFKLIEDTGRTVIIPWQEKGKSLCEQLRRGPELPRRVLLRSLQRYSVQIPEWVWKQQQVNIELVHDRYSVLVCPEVHYSDKIGLSFDGNPDGILCA